MTTDRLFYLNGSWPNFFCSFPLQAALLFVKEIQICHRIIVLDEGSIVLDDTPDRVRADERLNEIYFGEVA
jgi:ABC-type uncharacterized transport system ATPase subunit